VASEEEDEEKENQRSKANKGKKSALPKSVPKKSVGKAKVSWKGDCVKAAGGRKYYTSAVVDGTTYSAGDFALITCDDGDGYVRRVEYLFEEKNGGEKLAHVQWFMRGTETVLGEDSEDRELFQMTYCDNAKLCNVVQKVNVAFWAIPSDWKSLGGTERSAEDEPPVDFESDNSFYYRMTYSGDEHARFEHGFDVTTKVRLELFRL
jgi:DNA (cytosine-5)-methyltransferase 1